jgi:hypothetical protein
MYIDFSELFSKQGDRRIARRLIRIKGLVIPSGVTLRGLDLQPYHDKLLHTELQNGVYVIQGYYTFHPLPDLTE